MIAFEVACFTAAMSGAVFSSLIAVKARLPVFVAMFQTLALQGLA